MVPTLKIYIVYTQLYKNKGYGLKFYKEINAIRSPMTQISEYLMYNYNTFTIGGKRRLFKYWGPKQKTSSSKYSITVLFTRNGNSECESDREKDSVANYFTDQAWCVRFFFLLLWRLKFAVQILRIRMIKFLYNYLFKHGEQVLSRSC